MRAGFAPVAAAMALLATPAMAQDAAIDLSFELETEAETRARQRCEAEQNAEALSGEIVVCANGADDAANAGWDKEAWAKDYAARSALKGDPRTPKFIRTCRDQGNPFGCSAIGTAPTPALIIDVAALPEAPPGSDADRIAQGLAPRGVEPGAGVADPESGDGAPVSPAGSAAPAALR